MSEPLTLWIIKKLFDAASDPIRKKYSKKFSELILGDPLENALRGPTDVALQAAVASALGAEATEEQRQRAFDILGMFWKDGVNVGGAPLGSTITETLQSIVAAGINEANAPVRGLPEDYPATTSLTSLSDEMGIPKIDADAFAAVFTAAWLAEIRKRSVTNADLQQLANLLSDEETRDQLAGVESRLSEEIRSAVQSFVEHVLADGDLSTAKRQIWFNNHIRPAHQLMQEVAEDYQSGFGETLEALHTGAGLKETMQRLRALRRRKILGRTSLDRVAAKLEADRKLFGTSIDAPLIEYVKAVQAFKRADQSLDPPYGTWYSSYIDKFVALIEQGADPHERSNYTEIAAVTDLPGQLAVALQNVVDVVIPQRWAEYPDAYLELQKVVEAAT
ncbi:hypothetical protein [Mycolicibacterium sp. 120320]|uniref:hypothetical protein n=1 Tax=Mycolicibacterium sp. 120320 TaxID=3096110 RepID=UPI002ED8E7B8